MSSLIHVHDEAYGNIDVDDAMSVESFRAGTRLTEVPLDDDEAPLDDDEAPIDGEATDYSTQSNSSTSGSITRGKVAKIGVTLLAILAVISAVVILRQSNGAPTNSTSVSSSQEQQQQQTFINSPTAYPTAYPTLYPTGAPIAKSGKETAAMKGDEPKIDFGGFFENKKTKEPKPAPITPFPTEEATSPGTETVSTETTSESTTPDREDDDQDEPV